MPKQQQGLIHSAPTSGSCTIDQILTTILAQYMHKTTQHWFTIGTKYSKQFKIIFGLLVIRQRRHTSTFYDLKLSIEECHTCSCFVFQIDYIAYQLIIDKNMFQCDSNKVVKRLHESYKVCYQILTSILYKSYFYFNLTNIFNKEKTKTENVISINVLLSINQAIYIISNVLSFKNL